MSILSREQRYELLKAIKLGKREGAPLTEEEEQFIQDFASEKLRNALSDPEVMAVFIRMKDR